MWGTVVIDVVSHLTHHPTRAGRLGCVSYVIAVEVRVAEEDGAPAGGSVVSEIATGAAGLTALVQAADPVTAAAVLSLVLFGSTAKQGLANAVLPLTKVIGEDLANGYRWLMERADQLMEGEEPKPVRTKFALDLIRNAAGEQDPELMEMFARVLANEMRGKHVHPSYPGIIGQMAGNDAQLFRALTRERAVAASMTVQLPDGDSVTAFSPGGFYAPAFYSLERLGLIERRDIRATSEEASDERRKGEVREQLGQFLLGFGVDPNPDAHVLVEEVAFDVTGYGWGFSHAVLPPAQPCR